MNVVSVRDEVTKLLRWRAEIERWRAEIDPIVRSDKSTVKTLSVIERGPDLRPSKVDIIERELFAAERGVISVARLEEFESEVRELRQVTRELVTGLTAIVSSAEAAIVQARRSEALAVQSMDLLTAVCDAVGLDLSVRDGVLTLSSVPRNRANGTNG